MFFREAIFDEHDLDPSNYNEAIFYKDLRNWQNAMKDEMKYMYSKHVWELVEPSVNAKFIRCKWV